jgi:hypothetical protein
MQFLSDAAQRADEFVEQRAIDNERENFETHSPREGWFLLRSVATVLQQMMR